MEKSSCIVFSNNRSIGHSRSRRDCSVFLSLSLQCATRAGWAVTLSTLREPETGPYIIDHVLLVMEKDKLNLLCFTTISFIIVRQHLILVLPVWLDKYSYQEERDLQEYKLQDLLQCLEQKDHNETYKAIQEWLTNKLSGERPTR